MKTSAPSVQRRQRGAAILIAMIIVTLISTMAATMVWQQWRSVQVEASERVRSQAAWILSGALDYARLILREDSNSAKQIDHLGEPWAVPLAESRISTFLAGDNAGDGSDGPEAFLSGTIVDANSRYNLRNLLKPDGTLDVEHTEAFLRLCDSVGVSATVAQQIAQNMLAGARASNVVAASSSPSGTAPLYPQSVDQLRWFGIDAQTIKLLEPLIVILPETTKVNVNTASKEVLAGVVKGMDLGTAQRLVTQRASKPFDTVAECGLPTSMAQIAGDMLDVSTNYFEVTGRLRLGDKVLEERSLVRRQKPNTITPLQRRRLSSIDYAG